MFQRGNIEAVEECGRERDVDDDKNDPKNINCALAVLGVRANDGEYRSSESDASSKKLRKVIQIAILEETARIVDQWLSEIEHNKEYEIDGEAEKRLCQRR